MDLNNLSVFNMANVNMKYLTERQKVLASNVANANTPGYLAKDIEKPSFSQFMEKIPLRLNVTNEKHFALLPSQMAAEKSNGVYTPKPTAALTIDGNGVILEDQLNEVSKTKSEYNRMLTIYGKYKDLLSVANTKINA
ncbi:MAG: hypothetical protein J6A33_04325 [Alphaproteobacteria bacterium]|nr:hypothetical protein [Alphaproteobacteria bacterium]